MQGMLERLAMQNTMAALQLLVGARLRLTLFHDGIKEYRNSQTSRLRFGGGGGGGGFFAREGGGGGPFLPLGMVDEAFERLAELP